MIKGSIQEEDITIVNIYAPNIGTLQYIRQMLKAIKGEIDSNTIIIEDFNTPLSPMHRSSKRKINKETQASNDTLNKVDLIDIYRTFHPKTTKYTFFSSAPGTFSRIGHIYGHKSSLGKFKKMKLYQLSFPTTRYETTYQLKEIKSAKSANTWRLNNTVLNNEEITGEIKEEIKKYLETNDNENMTTQNLWDAAKAVLRGRFLAIQYYLKKQETSQMNNLTLHLEQLEKEEKKKNPNLAEGKK